MKSQILILGLFIGLLLGCDATNQDSVNLGEAPLLPKPEPPDKTEFDSVSFPQKSCGDSLPVDSQSYPVNIYPVFIDYSESNLKLITSEFCQDANKKIRKKTGKDTIQVASFVSLERANQFQEFMKKKLGSGEVGESSLITARGTPEPTGSSVKPEVNIGEAAKLTSAQVKQLISKYQNNSKLLDFKIIVPTYVPNGFKVDGFEVEDVAYNGQPDLVREYKIIYRNSANSCFSIQGNFGGWGDNPGEERLVEVSSPALGKVILGYTEFDQVSGQPYITFQGGPIMKGKQGFLLNSPSNDSQKCNTISLREAAKVVESLQYLNP